MREIGARGANEHHSLPKAGQDGQPTTQPTSPCAQKTSLRTCRPSQEKRARPEINPNPTLYPELQPNYSTYFTGAQYAPVVMHMPALVMHVKIAPHHQPQLPLQIAPTPTPTSTRAISRPNPDAYFFACDVNGHRTCRTPAPTGPFGSQLLWVDPTYPPIPAAETAQVQIRERVEQFFPKTLRS